jgi:hypothetical protein
MEKEPGNKQGTLEDSFTNYKQLQLFTTRKEPWIATFTSYPIDVPRVR